MSDRQKKICLHIFRFIYYRFTVKYVLFVCLLRLAKVETEVANGG